jgi:hypothetical protein
MSANNSKYNITRKVVLIVALTILSFISNVNASYYLPGVSPQAFEQGSTVSI